jgi:hypothetical protein
MAVLVVEQDVEDPAVWRYGVDGTPPDGWRRLRFDTITHVGERIGDGPLWEDGLYVTAALLVRQAGGQTRLVYETDQYSIPRPPTSPAPGPVGGDEATAAPVRTAWRGQTRGERAARRRH